LFAPFFERFRGQTLSPSPYSMQTIIPSPPRDRPDTCSQDRRGQIDPTKTGCGRIAPHLTPKSLAMIIVTRPDATEEQIEHIVDRIRSWGLKTEVSRGEMRVVIGVIGPEDKIREKPLGAFPGVESVTPVLKPYKLVAHEFRGRHSHVQIGDVVIGGREFVLMAGPCAVESESQITSIAKEVR